MPTPRGVEPESDFQWIDLEDFSAGIYDYSHVANTAPNVPGPVNAADPNETWACIALPQGGLGPLPKMAQSYQWPGDYISGDDNYITGLLVHDELGNGDTEAVAMFEADDGTTHYFQAWSYVPETNVGGLIVQNTPASSPGIFGSPYPQMTRAAPNNPTTTPGNPTIVFPAGGPAYPTGKGMLFLYPDPGNPTSYTPAQLIGTSTGFTGQVIVHQNRILVLAGTSYGWPVGGGFGTNEIINFTDPPNSETYGNQQTVLAAEQPYGYGCAGSISAGELFIVKKRGGGLVVTGDIFSPNVTVLPGVTSVGGIWGAAHSGPAGFAYCSFDNGAWLWNGGSTAQKISKQLDDQFFLPVEFYRMQSNNYGFFVRCIADRIYFSNNWMYDLNTGSWWRYYPGLAQGGVDLFYVNEVDGGDIWCGPLSFSDSNRTFLYRFNQETPTETWQWQGLPRRLTKNRYVEPRQIVVRASSNKGNTTSQITVAIFNGATQVGSVTTPSGSIKAAPTMIRMPIGAVSAGSSSYASEDLTIRISATGNGDAAPNLHSCSIGWNQRAQAPTVGVSS